MWNRIASAEGAEYKSDLAQYHPADAYQVHCSVSQLQQLRGGQQDAQVDCDNTILKNHLPHSEVDVSSRTGYDQATECMKAAYQVKFERVQDSSTAPVC